MRNTIYFYILACVINVVIIYIIYRPVIPTCNPLLAIENNAYLAFTVPLLPLDTNGFILFPASVRRLWIDVGTHARASNTRPQLDVHSDLAIIGFEPMRYQYE